MSGGLTVTVTHQGRSYTSAPFGPHLLDFLVREAVIAPPGQITFLTRLVLFPFGRRYWRLWGRDPAAQASLRRQVEAGLLALGETVPR